MSKQLEAKKALEKIINKYSYGEWRDGNFDHIYETDDYPKFLAKIISGCFRMEKVKITLR